MKKLAVVVFALIATVSLSAQKVIIRSGPIYRPPVVYASPYVGLGYGFGYNPFYGGLGYPYSYRGGFYRKPTKLDRQISDIENDYSDRIQSVKMDRSLRGHERRLQIRELKHERKEAVYDAQRNYYKQPYSNNYNSHPYNNNNY